MFCNCNGKQLVYRGDYDNLKKNICNTIVNSFKVDGVHRAFVEVFVFGFSRNSVSRFSLDFENLF